MTRALAAAASCPASQVLPDPDRPSSATSRVRARRGSRLGRVAASCSSEESIVGSLRSPADRLRLTLRGPTGLLCAVPQACPAPAHQVLSLWKVLDQGAGMPEM